MARKHVVAYVRVSSSSKAQIHSYEFQEQYWRGKFDGDPDNELVHIYADRGISGCSAYKRLEFMKMLQDARAGQFDTIHTKSVSRFARNTVELLEAVRELRDIGVEVIFEKEDTYTKASFNNTIYCGYHVLSLTIYRISFSIFKRLLIGLSDK